MVTPLPEADVCFVPLKPALPTKVALVWKKHAVFGKAAEAFAAKLRQL